MNIHQTIEYSNTWMCKGYKPLVIQENSDVLAIGRILYRYGLPYKTIWGGMCGSGILNYSEEVITKVLTKSKGAIEIYDLKEQPLLEEYGLKKSTAYTFIVDISNIKGLWEKIDKKNRNAIRFAEKYGAIFDEIQNIEQLNKLYALFKEQATRWNFRIPEKDYFENVWKFLVEKGMAKFFVASYQNEIVSIAQIFMLGEDISMPIWGNNEKAKKIKANNFLIWKIIEWGNKNRYKKFNMWGADPKLEGIYKFKESFGGELVKVYRYEKSWWLYNLAKKIFRK